MLILKHSLKFKFHNKTSKIKKKKNLYTSRKN